MAGTIVFKAPTQKFISTGYNPSTISNAFQIPYNLNTQQIAVSKTRTDGSETLYSVPQGYILFITTCSLGSVNYGAIASGQAAFLKLNQITILTTATSSNTASGMSFSLSFPFPYILRSNESIVLTGNRADVFNSASFTGFLVREQDLITK